MNSAQSLLYVVFRNSPIILDIAVRRRQCPIRGQRSTRARVHQGMRRDGAFTEHHPAPLEGCAVVDTSGRRESAEKCVAAGGFSHQSTRRQQKERSTILG